jgi:DNA-binding SARP family transcriptional activator
LRNCARRSGQGLLLTESGGYRVVLNGHSLDVIRFERLLDEGTRLLEEGDAAAAHRALEEALTLWRGPALLDVPDENEARRLEEQRLLALERRIDADLALGRHGRVVGELQELVARDPLRERPRAQLMLALYRSGRQAEALDLYREGRRLLVEELGLEPGPELQSLERSILVQDEAIAAPARGRRSSLGAEDAYLRPRRRWPSSPPAQWRCSLGAAAARRRPSCPAETPSWRSTLAPARWSTPSRSAPGRRR